MTENFPILMSVTKPQIQEAQKTPIRINAKKIIPWCIIFRLQGKYPERSQRGKIATLIEEQI